MASLELRHRVMHIYKGLVTRTRRGSTVSRSYTDRQLRQELLYLGREYPLGYDYFRKRLHGAFVANKGLTDPEEIERGIARAEFVKKGKLTYSGDTSIIAYTDS